MVPRRRPVSSLAPGGSTFSTQLVVHAEGSYALLWQHHAEVQFWLAGKPALELLAGVLDSCTTESRGTQRLQSEGAGAGRPRAVAGRSLCERGSGKIEPQGTDRACFYLLSSREATGAQRDRARGGMRFGGARHLMMAGRATEQWGSVYLFCRMQHRSWPPEMPVVP